MGEWLRAYRKAFLVHGLILSAFLLFCIFLSNPLFDRFEAIDGESKLQNVLLPAETESILYQIDAVEVGTYIAEVRGWAFIDGQSSENSQVYVVLKSDRKCYVFDTKARPWDYNDLNIDSYPSGFVCNIPSSEISSGEYVLGIYVKNGDIEAYQCTDRVLVKSQSRLEALENEDPL